jgi:hypothetical protein
MTLSASPPPGRHLRIFPREKNLSFLTVREPSSRKSTYSSNFVESDGIVQSMPFIGIKEIHEPFLRGASEHPNKALFQKGS